VPPRRAAARAIRSVTPERAGPTAPPFRNADIVRDA
jgi:hypothetical protein